MNFMACSVRKPCTEIVRQLSVNILNFQWQVLSGVRSRVSEVLIHCVRLTVRTPQCCLHSQSLHQALKHRAVEDKCQAVAFARVDLWTFQINLANCTNECRASVQAERRQVRCKWSEFLYMWDFHGRCMARSPSAVQSMAPIASECCCCNDGGSVRAGGHWI